MKTENPLKLPRWLSLLGYTYSVSIFCVAIGLTIQHHLKQSSESKLAERNLQHVAVANPLSEPQKPAESVRTNLREPASLTVRNR